LEKSKICILALIVASTIAASAYAGTGTSSLNRAQVHAELVQLRAAGYVTSGGNDTNYPTEILAAEARVSSQNKDSNACGGVATMGGSSMAGGRISKRHLDEAGMRSVYFGQ